MRATHNHHRRRWRRVASAPAGYGGCAMIPLDLRAVARALGGNVSGRNVVAPGPGHSHTDRSLSLSRSSRTLRMVSWSIRSLTTRRLHAGTMCEPRLPVSAADAKTVEHPVVAETIALSGAASRADDAPGNDAAAPDHDTERRSRPPQQCRRERIVSAATLSSATVIDRTATVPSREWWRREVAHIAPKKDPAIRVIAGGAEGIDRIDAHVLHRLDGLSQA